MKLDFYYLICFCYLWVILVNCKDLNILFCRGDHIVPNFEEIWPSKNPKTAKPKRGLEYYYDAMVNGPELSGMQIHVLKQFPISNLFHEIESEKKVRNGKKKKKKKEKKIPFHNDIFQIHRPNAPS